MSLEMVRKVEELDRKVGGRFRLTSLVQRRLQEVVRGSARPLEGNREPIDRVIAEIERGEIDLVPDDAPGLAVPEVPAEPAPRGPAGPPATF
ncbi:MAG: DNA-directed RNA polymerase subunit omega [Planctomycetes bacterium]|nr:DNA-directed RNA polymerase subunit omega [Planctomycetota bacterium]